MNPSSNFIQAEVILVNNKNEQKKKNNQKRLWLIKKIMKAFN